MKFLCRRVNQPQTEEYIDETDDIDKAPDYYVHKHTNLREGQTIQIEVKENDEWKIWIVTCIVDKCAYFTRRIILIPNKKEIK